MVECEKEVKEIKRPQVDKDTIFQSKKSTNLTALKFLLSFREMCLINLIWFTQQLPFEMQAPVW